MAYFPALRFVTVKARLFYALPVLLLGLALLTACKKAAVTDPNDPAFVVAVKDDWIVTRADLNKQIDDVLRQGGKTRDDIPASKMPDVEWQMVRYMVLKKLLLDKAAAMKLPDVDKQVQQAIDYIKNRDPSHTYTDADLTKLLQTRGMTLDEWKQNLRDVATMQGVVDASIANDIEPTEQEIDAIYEANKSAFHTDATIRASRVLVLVGPNDTAAQKAAKKKKIDAAHARVMKGEDFSKVAMEASDDRSSAPNGGDMGPPFTKGQNEPGFDEVAFSTKVNTVSPVFLDNLGYQFVKVTDSRPPGDVSLAAARAMIGPKIKEKKRQDAANAYAENLLSTSGVTINIKKPIDLPTQGGAMPQGPGGGGEMAPDASAGPAPAAPAPDQSAPPAPAPEPAQGNSAPDATLASPTLSATNGAPADQQQPHM